MNKKLYAVLILCWLCCSLQSIASDSSDTGCFTSNPLLPSSYLKGWVGVGANIATGSLIIATGSLSTKQNILPHWFCLFNYQFNAFWYGFLSVALYCFWRDL